KKLMKRPCAAAQDQYTKRMLRTISCASESGPPQRGQRSASDNVGLVAEVCSPMNFMSWSVAPGASCRLSCGSNQNAWQAAHTSTVTCAPKRASSVQAVISLPQLGQVMEGIVDAHFGECHRAARALFHDRRLRAAGESEKKRSLLYTVALAGL